MFVRHVIVSVTLVLVSAVPSYAGALLGCVRFPFQMTKHTDFPVAIPSAAAVVSFTAPDLPIEIEMITVKIEQITPIDSGGVSFGDGRITTTLSGQAVTHFLDFDGGTRRSAQVSYYSSPKAPVVFDFRVSANVPGRITVTMVGRIVSRGCWLAPQ